MSHLLQKLGSRRPANSIIHSNPLSISVFLCLLVVVATQAERSCSPHSSRIHRGGATSSPSTTTHDLHNEPAIMRVAYQGVAGAYSEKATRELLGDKVIAVGRPSFEDCFRAVASLECDYACLPIENSLGGSIHENYDLMLRYDLTIIGEHEFRVKHCLLATRGVKREDLKYAISHPQALAQCDNFLRGLGIKPIATYDTAGSAKMLAENDKLPDGCTPQNTCAIASDLAGRTYGLNCLEAGIEDDDTNFTRFLLLARKGVVEFLSKNIPAKTSIVFTFSNAAGALYKALACFALRDIDCSKIESRPTSASLLNFLKFKSQQAGRKIRNKQESSRFRYCFYLDFLANQLDPKTQNALAHLREQADYVRILGSFPQKSRLVGPVADAVERLKHVTVAESKAMSISTLPSDTEDSKPLRIGIVGFGPFGQVLAQKMALKHHVSCLDQGDKSAAAAELGLEFYPSFESTKFLAGVDIVVVTAELIDFETAVQALPASSMKSKLVVETCALNTHPKSVLLRTFSDVTDIDILSTHPMLGPVRAGESGDPYTSSVWEGRPMVYEKVRVSNMARCDKFLKIFEEARCQMVEMDAAAHDATVADAEFVTHLAGRLLVDKQLLPPSPVISKEYAALCDVADMTSSDSFDQFFGMFKYNENARTHLTKMRDNLARLEQQLAAKEAYLAAGIELRNSDRQRLLAETKLLLQEVAQSSGFFRNEREAPPKIVAKDDSQVKPPTKSL
ncbi:prephenate dehydrogenase [Mayamaea pseudoterrestris]|nr:prephenate dehydrogenase [Mayamaea pseudoterrestris]